MSRKDNQGYSVYILASKRNGTLYVGVTNNLARRIYEHKQGAIAGFTKRYRIDKLVYYEMSGDVISAITREKQIKKWNRAWKIKLIESINPDWRDLYSDII
jgi:putative endonuclease